MTYSSIAMPFAMRMRSTPTQVRDSPPIEAEASQKMVERRKGHDKQSIALYLTAAGETLREDLLKGRLAAIRPLLQPLTAAEQEALASLLHKMLSSMPTTDLERCHLCRLCADRVCQDCPIPAEFRSQPS